MRNCLIGFELKDGYARGRAIAVATTPLSLSPLVKAMDWHDFQTCRSQYLSRSTPNGSCFVLASKTRPSCAGCADCNKSANNFRECDLHVLVHIPPVMLWLSIRMRDQRATVAEKLVIWRASRTGLLGRGRFRAVTPNRGLFTMPHVKQLSANLWMLRLCRTNDAWRLSFRHFEWLDDTHRTAGSAV